MCTLLRGVQNTFFGFYVYQVEYKILFKISLNMSSKTEINKHCNMFDFRKKSS